MTENSTPQPSGEPERRPASTEAEPTSESRRARRVVPPSDKRDYESKRFAVADGTSEAPLVVTIADGDVSKDRAPLALVASLASRVDSALRAVGGAATPMALGVAPTNSMTFWIGDATNGPDADQLSLELTFDGALKLAQLIELEGDAFFRYALTIGPAARRYGEFAQFVHSEGISVRWKVRGEPARVLTPARAQRQFERLNADPEVRERKIRVNGILYRVIADPETSHTRGTVGIQLHGWSARPPAWHGTKILAHYETAAVSTAIREGLIGESVEAELVLRQPAPGTSIDPDRYDIAVADIGLGPPSGQIGLAFDADEDTDE